MKTRKFLVSSFLLLACLGSHASAEENKVANTSKTIIEPHTGMEFVWVEGGCYEMGCGEWQIDCSDDEKPPHKVCLDGFWIGKYEVTQGQWEKIMETNPSDFPAGDNHPVEMISWHDAQHFTAKLNNLNEDRIITRLPTEAEWEYAARSRGKKHIYAGTNSEKEGFWAPVIWQPVSPTYPNGQTFPVGSAKPNGLGLYDMSGNVMEWCNDWYGSGFYQTSPENNPKGPESGSEKVVRGGHIPSHGRITEMRTTARNPVRPKWSDFATGLRLVVEKKNSQ